MHYNMHMCICFILYVIACYCACAVLSLLGKRILQCFDCGADLGRRLWPSLVVRLNIQFHCCFRKFSQHL